MTWVLVIAVFLIGFTVGSVVSHNLMIRRYHMDRQWVLDWHDRWERKVYL